MEMLCKLCLVLSDLTLDRIHREVKGVAEGGVGLLSAEDRALRGDRKLDTLLSVRLRELDGGRGVIIEEFVILRELGFNDRLQFFGNRGLTADDCCFHEFYHLILSFCLRSTLLGSFPLCIFIISHFTLKVNSTELKNNR